MKVRLRASIASLMGLVLLVAFALAALKSPSELWAGLALSFSLVFFACAAVLAVVRRGRVRAAWAGTAIFGLVFLHAAFAAEISYPPLPTRVLLDKLASAFPGGDKQITWIDGGAGRSGMSGFGITLVAELTARQVPPGHFDLLAYRQISHSFLAIVLGGVGAIFGLLVGAERDIDAPPPRNNAT